jgi:hypothetical protein
VPAVGSAARRRPCGDADGCACACGGAAAAACVECAGGDGADGGVEGADGSAVVAGGVADSEGVEEERRCSICLEPFVGGQLVRSLPCSHSFHLACIDEWLTTQSRACPEDGLPIFADGEFDDEEEEEEGGDEGGEAGTQEAEAARQFERLVCGDALVGVGVAR